MWFSFQILVSLVLASIAHCLNTSFTQIFSLCMCVLYLSKKKPIMILRLSIYASFLCMFMLFYSYTTSTHRHIHTHIAVCSQNEIFLSCWKPLSSITLLVTLFTFAVPVNVTDSSQDQADCAQEWCLSSWIWQSLSHCKPQPSLCSSAASLLISQLEHL